MWPRAVAEKLGLQPSRAGFGRWNSVWLRHAANLVGMGKLWEDNTVLLNLETLLSYWSSWTKLHKKEQEAGELFGPAAAAAAAPSPKARGDKQFPDRKLTHK